jgi:O-antigen/teichoic acid export membrane protein
MVYGLPGAFVKLVIMQVFALLLVVVWSPLRPRPVFAGSRSEIFRDGFPLLAVALVFSFQFTINKALIAAGFGKAVVGSEYGLAAVGLTIMMVVPGALGTTSYPSMLKVFGAYGKAHLLRARVLRHTLFVAVLTALAAALGWFLLPPVVNTLLPAYLPGVSAARWILPGVIFFSASVPSTYFLQTIRHQDRHLVVSLCALALQIALVEWVIHRGGSVVQVCQVTSLSYAIYGLVLFSVFLYGARERAS